MNRVMTLGCLALAGAVAGPAQAGSFDMSGFIRVEAAYKTTDDENPYNQRGNLFNDKPTARLGGIPPTEAGLFPDEVSRPVEPADNDFNLLYLRGQLDFSYSFTSDLSFIGSIRGIYDPAVYDEFDPEQSGSRACCDFYQDPNYFEYAVDGNGNPLEWAGEDYLVDLPSFYFDYQSGPLLVRLGNQQIAWGQALFFRVLDVPNGIDYRRHSIIDFAAEEYSDKRVPGLGLRVAYQVTEDWDLDSYAQKFQPTVYGNANTPYNVIASQFTIRDRYGNYDDKLNYGTRLRGRLGPFGVQAVYSYRYNPDGVFRWTKSGVNRGLPGTLPNVIPGLTDNLGNLLQGVIDLLPVDGLPATGAVLAESAFEVDPTGVNSADEWFTYAAMARLDALAGLNSSITDFPATRALLAAPVSSDEAARRELDLFFQLSGGLRGHLDREYKRENVFGLGTSYVTMGTPGSWLDQLIINLEATYVPHRTFTNPDLGQDFLVRDEWSAALVMEKYQRLTQAFPATYFVLQYLHKSQSDIFGRHLSGYGGTPEESVSTADDAPEHGSNYVVFAFQQPFPSLVWRADLSVLYDVEGGILVQPAVRWKPNGTFTVEAFYNYIDTVSGNPNSNALSTAEWADEIGVRIGYQF